MARSVDEPAPAVETVGLVKRYGDKAALEGVDLLVPQGSLFGLVGSNGAGKTTLLGILAGRKPAEGRVLIAVARRRIAVLADTPRFDPWLTAHEIVDLARHLTDSSVPRGRVDDTLVQAGLGDARHRRVGASPAASCSDSASPPASSLPPPC